MLKTTSSINLQTSSKIRRVKYLIPVYHVHLNYDDLLVHLNHQLKSLQLTIICSCMTQKIQDFTHLSFDTLKVFDDQLSQ